MSSAAEIRESRLLDGCCPNCGTRLFKVTTPKSGVMSKIMFPKRKNNKGSEEDNNNISSGGGAPSSSLAATNTKMTPLSIKGVVERGQCLKCAANNDGDNIMKEVPAIEDGSSGDYGGQPIRGTSTSVGIAEPLMPSVQAVPVTMMISPIPPPSPIISPTAAAPPPLNGGALKQPPESLIGLKSKSNNTDNLKSEESSSSSEESGESDSDDDDSSSDGDDESLDDHQLEEDHHDHSRMCRLESDHASSSLVNSLRNADHYNAMISGDISGGYVPSNDTKMSPAMKDEAEAEEDDRKPAAKMVEESADRIRKLRLEAANALDMAYLENTTTTSSSNNIDKKDDRDGGTADKLQCPAGMSPDVFYELPPEMQKEVLAQESRNASNSSSNSETAAVASSSPPGTTTDIDPETLASLPDNIRQEVLEQARREQQKSSNTTETSAAAAVNGIKRPALHKNNKLSESTNAFLSDCDINTDDFENFPDEIKNEIMSEKRRRSSSLSKGGQAGGVTGLGLDSNQLDDVETSGYDPETLASLPEELRNEVLEEERRKMEKKRRESGSSSGGKRTSVVGAHSVHNVPAGYDPETFSELPEDMKQELLDDAARRAPGTARYTADGYDYDSIVDAMVVPARPMRSGGGTAMSCTYEGEYNIMGKRHGDGELSWANGDKYVGKFKDGYIDGRGTITFHDGE